MQEAQQGKGGNSSKKQELYSRVRNEIKVDPYHVDQSRMWTSKISSPFVLKQWTASNASQTISIRDSCAIFQGGPFLQSWSVG